MIFHAVNFTPSAQVSFTAREMKLMMECSKRHYDGRCQDAGRPGKDGFLYGWQNSRRQAHYSENVSTDQLDTLMKILEVGRHLAAVKDQRDAFGLGLNLRRTFARVQECYGRTEESGITLK